MMTRVLHKLLYHSTHAITYWAFKSWKDQTDFQVA